MKTVISFRKTFFLWKLFCRSRFLFWQRGWKSLQNFDFFTQSPETFVQNVFFHNVCFCSKKSFRKLECSFDNPVNSFLPNERRYLSRPPQKLPKLNVFQKCIPRKKFHWPRVTSTTLLEKLAKKTKHFWQEFQNICSKKCVSLKTISFSPEVPRKLKQIFDIPANKARQISKDHSFDFWKTLWIDTLFEKNCPRYFPLDQ